MKPKYCMVYHGIVYTDRQPDKKKKKSKTNLAKANEPVQRAVDAWDGIHTAVGAIGHVMRLDKIMI